MSQNNIKNFLGILLLVGITLGVVFYLLKTAQKELVAHSYAESLSTSSTDAALLANNVPKQERATPALKPLQETTVSNHPAPHEPITVPASLIPSPAAQPTFPVPIPPMIVPPPVSETPPTPLPAAHTSTGVGISIGDGFDGLTTAQFNAEFDDFVALGVMWLRFDVDWSYIQTAQGGNYHWQQIDKVVAAARARHIKVLGILDFTPAWARNAGCNSERCAPRDPKEFAAFAAAAATRYAPLGVHAWEIWNEPNTRLFWYPSPNVDVYATLLKATYNAIKAADPAATVIVGGLAATDPGSANINPLTFLSQLYARDMRTYFDAVAFHPYSYPVLPSYGVEWNAWQHMANSNTSMRSIMESNGDGGKQLWITEYGAPTGGPGSATGLDPYDPNYRTDHVTEPLQARMVTDAVVQVRQSPWAGPFFWYSYRDLGTSEHDTENFYGIIRADGSRKESYDALKEAYRGGL